MTDAGGDAPEEPTASGPDPAGPGGDTTPVPPTPVPPTPVPPTPVPPTPVPPTPVPPTPVAPTPVAQPVPPTEPATPTPSATDDWPAKAADGIVDLVDSVREVTTGRALTAATALVYGIVIAGAAIAALILLTIITFRLNERFYAWAAEGLFDIPDPQPMWAVYVTWGLICLIVGLLLWRKRPRLEPPAADH